MNIGTTYNYPKFFTTSSVCSPKCGGGSNPYPNIQTATLND